MTNQQLIMQTKPRSLIHRYLNPFISFLVAVIIGAGLAIVVGFIFRVAFWFLLFGYHGAKLIGL